MHSNNVAGSFAYKFIERFSVKAIGLIIGVILARLISPDEFGRLAILSVFISLSQTIIDSGFNTALIQNKDVTDDDYSTVFYLSLGLSGIIIAILFVIAPIISHYYGTNDLTAPLRVYSLALAFGAFNSIQTAKLQREMRFKAIMVCSLIAIVPSGVLGISMAYAGFGLWALIAYHGSSVVATSVCMLFVAKWHPKFVFSMARARVLFEYGWKILVSGVLCGLYNDVRSLVIGKKFSTEVLGFYNRGQQIPQMLSMTMDNSVQAVMLPVLSDAQDEKKRLAEMMKRAISLDLLILAPVMIGLAVVAESVVKILYTETWIPCVVYLQIICFAEIATPFISSGLIGIKAVGRSDVYMKLEFVRRIMMTAILLVSILCFDSVLAIAIGYIVSCWIDAILVAIPVSMHIGITPVQQMKSTWKIFICAAIMGAIVFALGLLNINVILKLCIQVVLGIVVYVVMCYFLRVDSFYFCLNMINDKFSGGKGKQR